MGVDLDSSTASDVGKVAILQGGRPVRAIASPTALSDYVLALHFCIIPLCLPSSFNFCCSHGQALGLTPVHEFCISYSHTE